MLQTATMNILDEFNNCPGPKTLLKGLESHAPHAEIRDLRSPHCPYWTNDRDTLVVTLDYQNLGTRTIMSETAGLGKMATDLHADEFDHRLVGIFEGDKYVPTHMVFRIWWD